MKKYSKLVTVFSFLVGFGSTLNSFAQSEASALSAISALPIASVLVSGASSAVIVDLPLALSKNGSFLVIKSVEASSKGVIYLLELFSDGVKSTVSILSSGAINSSAVAGSMVTVTVIGSGVLLSASGEVLALIPNAVGRSLFHNERLTP